MLLIKVENTLKWKVSRSIDYGCKESQKGIASNRNSVRVWSVDMFSVLQMQARSLHNEALLISIKNARIVQQRVLHLALGGFGG